MNMVSYSHHATLVDYLHSTGVKLHIQEKLLESQYSSQKPDDDFLQSLARVIGNNWLLLSYLLSCPAHEVEFKTEEERTSQADQALHMLRRWASKEEATYGLLCERFKTVSLFQS